MGRTVHHQGRHRATSPLLRPVIFTAVVSATLAAVVSSPAYAAPPIPGVPDVGSRPQAVSSLTLPGATAPGVTTPINTSTLPSSYTANPIAAQVEAKETELNRTGQQLLALEEQVFQATAAVTGAQNALVIADAALAQAQAAVDAAAAEAVKEAAALPPGAYGSDLYDIGSLWRIQRGAGTSAEAATRDLERAKTAALTATQTRDAALATETQLKQQYAALTATYKAQETALLQLREQNADQLAALAAQQDQAEAALGADYLDNSSIAGMVAHPKALAAVQFAMSQRGKWYEWGAEGPDTYDCSGLMWASYRQGANYYGLPRVARDQYYATRAKNVSRYALLPGDMIFFSTSSRWSDIYHVGMYIGEGKMVVAPSTGQQVKVQTVRWSRFFAATRVFGAVTNPGTTPSGSAGNGNTGSGSDNGSGGNPTPSPSPTKGPGTSPSPSPSGGSGSPSPSPSGSGSGSPSPSPSGSGSGSPSPAPPTPTPTTQAPSPEPTTASAVPDPEPTTEEPTNEPSRTSAASAPASSEASSEASSSADSSASASAEE